MPSPADTPQQSGPDVREAVQLFIEAVRRHLPRVVFTTMVFLLLGVFLSMLWPAKYESETQFLLREVRIVFDTDVLDDLGEIPLPRKMLSLSKELKSMNRVSAVLQELQWTEWMETAGNPSRRKSFYRKVAKNLDVALEADVTGGINATLAFQWTTRKKATDFVNRLRGSWIKRVLDGHRQSLENRKEAAERVVLDRQEEYNAALEALRTYEEENKVHSLSTSEINHEIKAGFSLDLAAAKAALAATLTSVSTLEQALAVIEPEIEVPSLPSDPAQLLAYQKWLKAETAFEDIAGKYTPAHRKYEDADQQRKLIEAKLDEVGGKPEKMTETTGNQIYLLKASELQTAQQEQLAQKLLVDSYEKELGAIEGRLDRLPIVTADLSRLQAEVTIASELLTSSKLSVQPLRDKVRALRSVNTAVNQPSDSSGNNAFEIIDYGIEPEFAVMPIGSIIMAISLMLGVGLGLSGPVLAELTRSSFGSAKEVSRNLGLPVLGAVDMILTARDERARAVQSALTLTTMVLVLAALSTALFIYSEYSNVLPASVLRSLRDVQLALT
ncbi:MAG: hypothetical protein ACI9EF_000039 [Pseudohongiellaceae bacterium]|jgi:hypothetical protein